MLLFTRALTPTLLYPYQEPPTQFLPIQTSYSKPTYMDSANAAEVKQSTSHKLLQYSTDVKKNIVRVSSNVKRRLTPKHKRNAVKSIDIKPEYSRSNTCWVEEPQSQKSELARHFSLSNAVSKRSAKVAVEPVERVTMPSAVDSESESDSNCDIDDNDKYDSAEVPSRLSSSTSMSSTSKKISPVDIPVIYDAYDDN